jgi:diamine N-acetyltransferase
MIAERFQGKGYGRAAMLEVIRRLKLHPDVELRSSIRDTFGTPVS